MLFGSQPLIETFFDVVAKYLMKFKKTSFARKLRHDNSICKLCNDGLST